LQIAEFRDIDLAAVYRELAVTVEGCRRPYTVINMVSSLDGKATIAGRVAQLGSPIDRIMMRKVRLACDALLYGAGTLRAENVDPRVPADMVRQRVARGTRPQPLRVVVSALGQVPLDNLFFRVGGEPAVVFTTTSADEAAVARLREKTRVFVVGDDWVDLRRATAILTAELGIQTMVAEGGPVLNYELIRDGLADELLLTLAPKIVAGSQGRTIVEGPELPPSTMPQFELLSVYRHEAELFLRYRVLHPPSQGV
jgi:riboflavin-specific deaminase-like protein